MHHHHHHHMGYHIRHHDSSHQNPLPPSSPLPISERRESLPLTITPPPRTYLHVRHGSCPAPFSDFLPSPPPISSNDNPTTTPPSISPCQHTRSMSLSFNINNQLPTSTPDAPPSKKLLTRQGSDPGLLPSTSNSILHNYQQNHKIRELYNKESDLLWPFQELEGLDSDEIRETAYEIFFTACRSSPGFGGRNALTFISKHENENENGGGTMGGNNQVQHVPQTSKVKRALGLKMLRSSLCQRIMEQAGCSSPLLSMSPVVGGSARHRNGHVPPVKPKRQMSMAEVMRVQMKVSEMNASRLRKTLMKTVVGQLGRLSETIILPLELLRHLKPSEFGDPHEYHLWQRRQLKILEAGLLLHPSIPIEKNNTHVMNLRDIIRTAEYEPLDPVKNSEVMRTFSNSVASLSMRSQNGIPTNVCHWANGFPVNIHLYISLLQSIFDQKDETLVLDEVDDQLELIKKTWSTLGINKPIHNVCFAWVLFQQYVETGQVEPDLLCASHAMLSKVENDAKREKGPLYVKILKCALSSLQGWADKRLLNYHDYFPGGAVGQMENLLPVVLSTYKILGDVTTSDEKGQDNDASITSVDSSRNQIDDYIRSSLKNAFIKIMEAENGKSPEFETKEYTQFSEVMLELAQETEDLAMKERENYSSVLKKWHTTAVAVAVLTLNNCYGNMLEQYLSEMKTSQIVEIILVLQRARKLEDNLVQMVVEDVADCEDGGKTIVREMVPFEVDSTILSLISKWIDESVKKGMDCLQKAKEIETWNPKSKSEPYAKSAEEILNLAKIIVKEFFKIPTTITEHEVQELADGFQKLFREYSMFAASCGLKENYLPSLPPLTRCNGDSKFQKLWKIASPCSVICEDPHIYGIYEKNHPYSCTSRGTQRLYIRLNTLHYLLSHIPSLDKSLFLTPGVVPSKSTQKKTPPPQGKTTSSYFEAANSSILAACQHLSEVASYRLIFLDSNAFIYGGLYIGGVANARIHSALTVLKHNIKLMTAILTERGHVLAIKEVMKATFDAFLMVLLAGGIPRMFIESDHMSIQEDFESLKQVFKSCGEELIAEHVVDKEAEPVEGVIALMGMSTEELVENLNFLLSETKEAGVNGNNGQKMQMPPSTGKWNRSDPNTILRVLCYRNDRAANHFLKRTFHIAKRR